MPSPAGRLASQAIHIVANPSPINLAESKLILNALQKFGEVVTFRNLKYDTTNTSKAPTRPILAIFDSPDAAKQAISSSPLTIRLPNTDPAHTHNHDTQSEPSSPLRARKPDARSKPEFLRCEILPSRHNHESALQRNPFHGTFRVYDSTYQYRDLVKTGIPLKELADETMSRKRHEPFRVKRQMMKENKRLGATSLMRLYREGLGENIVEDGEEGHLQEEDESGNRAEPGVDRLGER
ncbi:hypothetical protein Aspvir_006411 [Aspergillus viridinutans]|uniref:RRM domain-containing protein n=1 Tax=Aspergillus viridinutans TaxID=75553 RepID=A0A9P3BUQ7_ASPVI|nr:uncharacterized protein Aspvir_006411 [Aspergillus viridinutans]GIK02362.1 hypothetical protein Aspvir_006411 [Aspergillus viridinutans]